MKKAQSMNVVALAVLSVVGCGPNVPKSPPSEVVSAQKQPSNALSSIEIDPCKSGQRDCDPGVQGGSLEETTPRQALTETRDTPPPLPLPEGTKILHVGDSFAGALGLPLAAIFERAGVRSVLKHTDASYLTDWAWDGNLQKYIWKYNPDLIIVTLGANELEIVKPELRERTIKKIVTTIGNVPCVWVAIPLWAGPKNGLLEVIKESASPCVYMDTNALLDVANMPRTQDGIHPTAAAREAWAVDVALWLRLARKPTAERPWNLH